MSNRETATFEQQRPFLAGLAYRMLGSVADAEDVVQEAYLRWRRAGLKPVDNPRAYLSTIVSRLCLDRLKEARRRREIYVGEWLPDPIVNDPALSVSPHETVAQDVSFALMLALERLTPLERAAFLLHDVFDMDFSDIAVALDRNEPACRQLAARARGHVRQARPRFSVAPEKSAEIVEAFFAATRSGDADALRDLLAEDAVFHADGGGRVTSVLNPVFGREKIMRFYAGIARKAGPNRPRWRKRLDINGLPGELAFGVDGALQTTALEISGGRITAVYVTRNPDKLRHLAPLAPEGETGLHERPKPHS